MKYKYKHLKVWILKCKKTFFFKLKMFVKEVLIKRNQIYHCIFYLNIIYITGIQLL